MAERELHLFVDNSNVLLEGRRFAEMKRKRRPKLGAFLDNAYEIDWGKFLYVVKETDTRALADVPYLYGSRPPPNDSVWQRIRDDGFDVKVFDRNIRNKEKGVDMEMGMDIAERLHTVPPPRTILIAAGDADYVPAVTRAQSKGWKVEVWFWSNAAEQLKAAASRFCSLDKYLDYLRLETLDYLAPDGDVMAEAGFRPEKGTTRPTQRQKALHVLRKRRLSREAIRAPELAISMVDELGAAITRTAYTRGSISAHGVSSSQEVRQLKMYVDAVLSELLEIYAQ